MRFIINNNNEYECNLILIDWGRLDIFKDDDLLLSLPLEFIHSIIKKEGNCSLKNNGMVFRVMRTVLINTNLNDDVEEECFYEHLLDYIKEHKHELILIN